MPVAGEQVYDLLYKLIVIGDSGCGKSCLLHHFIEGRFKGESGHTIGVEFGSRVASIAGKRVKLQIWDTAGQERFRSVTRSYYRGAVGCVVVYDITDRRSFERVSQWVADARALAHEEIVITLAGNKADTEASRAVPLIEASQLASTLRVALLETSAANGLNVEQLFLTTARTIMNRDGGSGSADPTAGSVGIADPSGESVGCAGGSGC